VTEPVVKKIANKNARRLLLNAQGLVPLMSGRLDADGLHGIIRSLGHVQVDSIRTVARAHDSILFSRHPGYRPALLSRLLEKEARLFENWSHDAAIIPSEWFPQWQPRFVRLRKDLSERGHWRNRLGDDPEAAIDRIRAVVTERGPTMARELLDPGRGPWWGWSPTKTALEYLWRTGELAIRDRVNFQKRYDLTARVLPAELLNGEPRPQDHIDWACRSALERLVFGTPREIAGFWGSIDTDTARQWCERHLDGDVIQVFVSDHTGDSGRTLFALATIDAHLAASADPPGRVRALSPFDPVLRNRPQTAWLFGFDYRIEIFVPAARRRFGYYVFPLLERDRLIGRIDMKHDRSGDRLAVAGLWLEPGIRRSRGRTQAIMAELDRQRRFVGAKTVHFPDSAWRS
jgi:hypothetical protein